MKHEFVPSMELYQPRECCCPLTRLNGFSNWKNVYCLSLFTIETDLYLILTTVLLEGISLTLESLNANFCQPFLS